MIPKVRQLTALFILLPCCVSIGKPSTNLNAGYFDIAVGSPSGTEVTGRLNPKANREGDKVVPNKDWYFTITGGEGAETFAVESRWDQFGHMFGVLKLAEGQTLSKTGPIKLEVALMLGKEVADHLEVDIHVSKATHWREFHDSVLEAFQKESRVWGRVDISEQQAEGIIRELIDSKGRFPEMDYDDPNDGWINICNHIGGLGRLSVLAGKYGPNGSASNRQLLRKALYHAYVYLHEQMPVDMFSEYEEIAYSNRSHQWRYTDPLTGSAVFAFDGWLQDMHSEDAGLSELATDAHEKLLHILNISWQAPSRNRPIPDDKVRYSGYWADANRDHRMRTWIGMTLLMRDYNRPITYAAHWYPYTSGKHAGFSLLPGWEPIGSFYDLQTWVQTNIRPAYFYWDTARASGFFPDGSISHHTGHGNDTALFAYGFSWLADKCIRLGGWFTGTPWEISDPFWSDTADYLAHTYDAVVYRGGHDMTFSGRSHNSSAIPDFGKNYLLGDLQLLLKGKPASIDLDAEGSIRKLIKDLKSGTHQRSLNIPFWNGTGMIHRRGGISEDPYYMSVKMVSTRTRGAEGFEPDMYSYHMGDGLFTTKTTGREYFDSRFDWDWHVLPGTTVEWRTDPLPWVKSTYDYATGNNTYAGVVSNGKCGAASFVMDRSSDPYATVVAKKSYFMFDKVAVLLGSGIQRVHPGQGEDIVTTIDQASWTTDITYNLGDIKDKVVQLNKDVAIELGSKSVSWFHQGSTGYVVWPSKHSGSSNITLKTGSNINDTDPYRSAANTVFHLSLSHGAYPDPGTSDYAFAIIPNVTAAEMKSVVSQLERQLTIHIDNKRFHGVNHAGDSMTQVAFFKPTSIESGTGLGISVDASAMVLIEENQNEVNVVLSDPDYSETEPAITLNLPRSLKSGSYTYNTMGVWKDPAETVEVTPVKKGTQLKFHLPDPTDADRYDNRHEVYYGMPARVSIPVVNR
ncbi:MAG: polysaccharide lyase family 8 super-sandwich domain-containing protein [Puniceicoccaceae bacterium]